MFITDQRRNELIEAALPIVRPIAVKFHAYLADDIVQDFALNFEKRFLCKFTADGGQSWETFLHGRMKFFCLDFYRRRENHPTANYTSRSGRVTKSYSTETVTQNDGKPMTIGDSLERSYFVEEQQRSSVRRIVGSLSPQEIEIFELYYVDGLTLLEIAKIIEKSESWVSLRMKSCIEKMRREAERDG